MALFSLHGMQHLSMDLPCLSQGFRVYLNRVQEKILISLFLQAGVSDGPC